MSGSLGSLVVEVAANVARFQSDMGRIAYIAQVFSSMGFPVVEARSRAFLLYSYEVAESLLSAQGSSSQREERARLVERLLQAPLPAAER